jgi:hypothetical protein
MSIRRRCSYANVMVSVAVFVALGGSSYAVAGGSIGSRQLKDNAVRSADLRNNDVRGKDVRNGTLTGADIRESTLRGVPTASRAAAADHATRADAAGRADSIAAPEGFHAVGTPGEPPFNPGCQNNTGNPAFPPVGFYKDREGVVHLRGAYTCTSAGALGFNLPAGYRPGAGTAHTQAIVCFGGGNCPASHTTLVQVIGSGFAPGADGGILADATIALLDGVAFRAGS